MPNNLLKPRYFIDKLQHKSRWRLNKDHDLELIVNDTRGIDGEVLTLKSEIVSVSSDELVFLITSKKERNIEVTRLLKLSGGWQADKFNRLVFRVSKKDDKDDVLVLDGAWDVGKNNEIVYRYKKTHLKRKTKEERLLIFKGHWQITAKDRLAYMLDTSGGSGFLFKVQLESARMKTGKGMIRYRVGIGISEGKRIAKKIVRFFGMLKCSLTDKDEIVLELAGSRGKRPGVSVTLNKKIFGGETFLRFKRIAEESKVQAGIKIPF